MQRSVLVIDGTNRTCDMTCGDDRKSRARADEKSMGLPGLAYRLRFDAPVFDATQPRKKLG